MQHPAKPGDMVIEGRISPIGGHNRVAGRDDHAHQKAQQPVYPLADDDMGGSDTMMCRQCVTQIKAFRIAIHPCVRRGFANRLYRAWRGAETAFICSDPRLEGAAICAHMRLWPDKGHRCG